VQIDVYVVWPGGEREHLVFDSSRPEPKGLATARNLLAGLSISGSVVRGSVSTGRAQTLTSLLPSASTQDKDAADFEVRAVQIAGEHNAPLAIVAALSGRDDSAVVNIIADGSKIGTQEIAAIVGEKRPAMVVLPLGAKTDAAVDEAYGLALYLGAAMSEGNSSSAAPLAEQPSAPPLAQLGHVSMDEVTLEQLALLHQRSALILCGFAQGSRDQAQAWDDWLESYRLPTFEEGLQLLVQAGEDNIVSVKMFVGNALWGELRTMPFRFIATFDQTSGYAIPWEANNIPDISDFQSPDPSQGARQAAVASLVGKVERLRS
jgi:hypothetical protein